MLLFHSSISISAADALIRWAKLIKGDTSALLPQYTTMKGVSDKIVRQKQANKEKRIACTVNIPVPPCFNDDKPTVVFEHKDILSTCAEMISDPRIVSEQEDFIIAANTLDSMSNRLYTREISSGNWWLRTMEEEGMIGLEMSMSLLVVILFLDKTNLTRFIYLIFISF